MISFIAQIVLQRLTCRIILVDIYKVWKISSGKFMINTADSDLGNLCYATIPYLAYSTG